MPKYLLKLLMLMTCSPRASALWPKAVVVAQAQVDLVDDGHAAAPRTTCVDAAHLVGVDRGAGGVAGRGQQHAARGRAPGRRDRGRIQLEALRRWSAAAAAPTAATKCRLQG
jgi:hypothetical protein